MTTATLQSPAHVVMSESGLILPTATAEDHPCELYAYHSPVPCRTQGHHIFPVYLQNRLWGRIRIGTLKWLCGTCHDNVHDWLSWLMREAREPSPHPGRKAKAEAAKILDWYLREKNAE